MNGHLLEQRCGRVFGFESFKIVWVRGCDRVTYDECVQLRTKR
jgi:hypothetical protein